MCPRGPLSPPGRYVDIIIMDVTFDPRGLGRPKPSKRGDYFRIMSYNTPDFGMNSDVFP
jgi:hypothetical protein